MTSACVFVPQPSDDIRLVVLVVHGHFMDAITKGMLGELLPAGTVGFLLSMFIVR